MKFPARLLLALLLGPFTLSAQDKAAPAAPTLPPNMTVYYFCLLTKGPKYGTETKEKTQAAMKGHFANMKRLAAEGKLLVAGPFADNGEWRGLFILKCASLEEANALVATDPAVIAGGLKPEIHPWLTEKGSVRDPEFPATPPAQTP